MAAQPQSPFGALLRRFRLDANLSQETLARRAGLSREALSALERVQSLPETVRLLADALELDGTQHTAFTAASRWRDSAHQPVPSSPQHSLRNSRC
ncbi:MAG: helix-turn-helix transcriptional regulator [Chloroflexia bacterium]